MACWKLHPLLLAGVRVATVVPRKPDLAESKLTRLPSYRLRRVEVGVRLPIRRDVARHCSRLNERRVALLVVDTPLRERLRVLRPQPLPVGGVLDEVRLQWVLAAVERYVAFPHRRSRLRHQVLGNRNLDVGIPQPVARPPHDMMHLLHRAHDGPLRCFNGSLHHRRLRTP